MRASEFIAQQMTPTPQTSTAGTGTGAGSGGAIIDLVLDGLRAQTAARARVEDAANTARALAIAGIERQLANLVRSTADVQAELNRLPR